MDVGEDTSDERDRTRAAPGHIAGGRCLRRSPASLLVPWIVVLDLVQPRFAPVGDLALAAGGAMTVTTGGLLVSAALTLIRSPVPGHDVERDRDGRALHRLLPRRHGDREQPAGGRLRDPARGRAGRRALRPRRPPRHPATDLGHRPAARPAVRPRRRRDGPGLGTSRARRGSTRSTPTTSSSPGSGSTSPRPQCSSRRPRRCGGAPSGCPPAPPPPGRCCAATSGSTSSGRSGRRGPTRSRWRSSRSRSPWRRSRWASGR